MRIRDGDGDLRGVVLSGEQVSGTETDGDWDAAVYEDVDVETIPSSSDAADPFDADVEADS